MIKDVAETWVVVGGEIFPTLPYSCRPYHCIPREQSHKHSKLVFSHIQVCGKIQLTLKQEASVVAGYLSGLGSVGDRQIMATVVGGMAKLASSSAS